MLAEFERLALIMRTETVVAIDNFRRFLGLEELELELEELDEPLRIGFCVFNFLSIF